MKYIKLYKIFESVYISSETISIISNEIKEEIDDINLEISEENPNRDRFWAQSTADLHKNLKLRIDDSPKQSIVDELLIKYDYMMQIITLTGSVSIYKSAIKKLKRICSYLSNKHNIDLNVIYIFDTYVISDKKLLSIIYWIFFFEFKYSRSMFNTLDGSALNDYTSLSTLRTKWNMLSDRDFLFRSMTTSYKTSYSSHPEIIIPGSSFNGFFVYTTDIDKNKILVFKFDRGNDIGENMKYNVDIYFDTISPRNKIIPLPQLISKSESNFTRVERFTMEFDVYDKEKTSENFFKILIDKTIQFFKIEKMNLLNKISSLLEETNEFFTAVEIDVYLESRENTQLGIVQFVIYDIDFDDDKIFTIYVDDNLNMYINSIKEENKTSLEELIHDIYLEMPEKNKVMFEGVRYYEMISNLEYNDSIFGKGLDEANIDEDFIIEKWDKFKDGEISEIMKFYPGVEASNFFQVNNYYIYSYILGGKDDDNFGELIILGEDVVNNKRVYTINLSVVKLKDEWYYISLPKHKSKLSKISYWKCDQFEGLIEFIKNEVK